MRNKIKGKYRSGNYYLLCDRCSHKMLITKARKEWNGYLTCDDCFDPKQPQLEDPRFIPDGRSVPDSMREPEDTFGCPFEVWNSFALAKWEEITCKWDEFPTKSQEELL